MHYVSALSWTEGLRRDDRRPLLARFPHDPGIGTGADNARTRCAYSLPRSNHTDSSNAQPPESGVFCWRTTRKEMFEMAKHRPCRSTLTLSKSGGGGCATDVRVPYHTSMLSEEQSDALSRRTRPDPVLSHIAWVELPANGDRTSVRAALCGVNSTRHWVLPPPPPSV